MTQDIKKVYKSAIKNKEFLEDIDSADGDKKPGLFASDTEKHIFTSVYYGWLVGKYRDGWENKL